MGLYISSAPYLAQSLCCSKKLIELTKKSHRVGWFDIGMLSGIWFGRELHIVFGDLMKGLKLVFFTCIYKCFFLSIFRFINARRRIVQPMIDQSNRAGESHDTFRSHMTLLEVT